jgi:rRNA-processing protein FCF1
VRSAQDPARIAVVTADKQLADRARHRGARVYSPRAFLDRCTG